VVFRACCFLTVLRSLPAPSMTRSHTIRLHQLLLFEADIAEPVFALSWLITWFAHDLQDPQQVCRLYDMCALHPGPACRRRSRHIFDGQTHPNVATVLTAARCVQTRLPASGFWRLLIL
jgi:hypothetical protein